MRSGPERALVDDYVTRFDRTGRALGLGPLTEHEVEDKKNAGMAAEADAWLEAEGVEPARRASMRAVELRYEGQNFEVRVPLGTTMPTVEQVLDAFAREHERTNGYAIPARGVELVNCRLTAVGRVPRGAPEPPPEGGSVQTARIGLRRVYFDPRHGWHDTPVHAREKLPVGGRITGPAIIEEMSSTSIVFPGQWATLDADGNLIIRHEDAAAPLPAARETADA